MNSFNKIFWKKFKVVLKKLKNIFHPTKSSKARSKTPPGRGSKIPLRYKEPKQVGEQLNYSRDHHRKSTGDANLDFRSPSFEQKIKQKKSDLSKTIQFNKSMQNDQSSFSIQQKNQKRHHEISHPISINHNLSSDQGSVESSAKKKQKEFSRSINPQLPANDKLTNILGNFESDSNISSINLVEMKVNKIASVFGSSQSITNFLEKTKELKIIPNISQLNHTKDLFKQMMLEIQHIRIRNFLPKDLRGLSCSIMNQRLKSMRQVRSFELAINFMQNEFNLFNYKIQENLDDFDHIIPDRIEVLFRENEKLREKVNFLQKQFKDKTEENSILNDERKDIILQIKDLLLKINKQKEKNKEDITRISEKLDKFSESREKLLLSYKLANKQIKKLEKAKFSILEKNAKTVTIKGKVYNDKTIDDEIAQFMSKKESILNGLDKIELHEKKLLSTLKSAFDE